MKKLALILALCAVLFTSCNQGNSSKKGDKLYIVTTTQMIADAVRNIAGDKAEVVSLMGPGIDPHFYKATQGDLKKLTDADIIFYNGLHLEGKMQDVFEKFAKKKTVIAVTKDIPKEELIVSSDQGEEIIYDPHVWHDAALWSMVTIPIKDALLKWNSLADLSYQSRAEDYFKELNNLDNKLRQEIASIPKEQRLLITSHDAFNYYGKTYDIEVQGLQGISTVSEIGIKDITKMVDLIIKRKVKAVFVESSVNERNLQAVIQGCKKKGWEVKVGGTLFSDAMGDDDTPEGTYVGMIQHNTNAIVNALK
jgi:manganese/zinc/iron transport system substrate-binding protein